MFDLNSHAIWHQLDPDIQPLFPFIMNRLYKFSMVIGHTKSPWLRQQSSSTKSHVLQMFAFVLFPLLLRQVEGQALQNLFKVALYGANEVGYPGAPTASGSAEIDFDLGADVVDFKMRSDDCRNVGLVYNCYLVASCTCLSASASYCHLKECWSIDNTSQF